MAKKTTYSKEFLEKMKKTLRQKMRLIELIKFTKKILMN